MSADAVGPAAHRSRSFWGPLFGAWLIALVATTGAIFLGEVMGMTPCVLCWYQRIAMFPLALILGIDRFMSECRALTNFIGNAVATIVVARWEGALDTERLAAAMAGMPMALPEEDIERHERSGPHSAALAEAVGQAR